MWAQLAESNVTMPLIRHTAQRALSGLLSWAAPAASSAASLEFTRSMGTERRPGQSGAWRSSMWLPALLDVVDCFGGTVVSGRAFV